MKVLVKVVLVAAIGLLIFISWKSIQGPIDFQKQSEIRNEAVKQRLIDIRTAQVAFREAKGEYTASFDSLINFVKNGEVAMLQKYGDLTEEQMEAGMTESKAMNIINTGNETAIKKAGLWDGQNNRPQLRRDTIFVPVIENRFTNRRNFAPDSLRYVPYGNGAQFEMATDTLTTSSGFTINVFEAKAPYTSYLGDLNKNELNLLIENVRSLPGDRYVGMRVGSIKTANNNAGNWE
ncbi:MAG: hypothetical protein PHO84_03005 [Dysgonamonadaceae bacterium]|jgi:hypothetical protein|nr:hypothetical protein [Dysgonamonadaceae bacterium]MDD3357341.1 hypothetical protein [Dysgonamonadaceae bacterium]MDD3727276.1 hypothetical protein [Dysgonamonadaceae bacterium]MDD4246104.1 hypothetical protein [Dysgonamonadaceae bacterium]MDD4605214.1 hypothetical protein [Dysgonamonadaceae bacterium]